MNADVISKADGAVSHVRADSIDLNAPSIVRLDIARADVAGFERSGDDLVIRLVDGGQVRIAHFYPADGTTPNEIVLEEADHTLWHARIGAGMPRFSLVDDLTALTAVGANEGGSSLVIPALLGGIAAAGGVTVLASSGTDDANANDNVGNGAPLPIVGAGGTADTVAPAMPTAIVRDDGRAVTGRGEAGATVAVRDAAGTVVGTATVAADGGYVAAVGQPQVNGERLTVTQADAAGNVSAPAFVNAPDLTAPAAPDATVDAAGLAVTGRGEPGATVTVRDAGGAVLATAIVVADGTYVATLSGAQQNGQALTVVQTDAAGNTSPPTGLVAPDTTAPAAPTATVGDDGTIVTGTGEPGGTVAVADGAGTVIGTGTVAPDGGYTVTLNPPQTNGGTVTVTQSDPAGNTSPGVIVTAPDTTAPAAPTATVADDGTIVTGTGEPGGTVAITDGAGTVIGTGTVAPDGGYTVTLTPPQTNGGTVTVTQSDPAGNTSPSVMVTAPDITAPDAPTATVSVDGTQVAGTGEAGATVTVADGAGTVIGTGTVAADGSYTVTLTPPQANGGTVTVAQADAAGNVSPEVVVPAPDITAPPAPVATVGDDGGVVTGTGEPGATVTVTDAAGTVLGSATVTTQGAYAVVLAPPQIDSQPLAVTQTDAAGNASPATGVTAPDLTAPVAPTGTVAGDGASLSGTGEPGATVTVRDPLGVVLGTAAVAADGGYTVALTPVQIDGETLSVVQVDPAGNASPPGEATAPDLVVDTDPLAPTAAVGADGAAVSGTAEAGAAITVYDASGAIIATGTADGTGAYTVALAPPRIDGETVRVTQTQADGDVSPPATAIAPDLTAPDAPTATLDPTGNVVTGTGEPGATVTVTAADGTVLGDALVGTDGGYTVTLTTAQANGETLSVSQADAAGNVSPEVTLAAPDVTAPDVPTAAVTGDGTQVVGTGEPGATITVTDAAGIAIGMTTVASDGSYAATLTPPQANGGTLSVSQADTAGNVSPEVTLAAPDITAPEAPSATVSGDGTTVTGTGEVGGAVTITDATGTVIGTATVAADGSYVATLVPPQANGGTLAVSQADTAGNVSPEVTLAAPDITAPDAPTATVSADGTQVAGTGEVGATVTVADAAGVVIGTGTVAADGSYVATLVPPQANGGTVTISQADATGNISPGVIAAAPDITAPAAPIATVSVDGTQVAGTGEAGATVTVTVADGAGTVIGTGTVAADGSYTVTLTPPQANGGTVTVAQADAAGNVSPEVVVPAPDITAPPAPVATVGDDGGVVTGTGEPGATVTVTDADGTVLGSATVTTQGAYAVVLAPPQIDSQPLAVTQTDAAGNASPATGVTAPDLTAPAAPTGTVAGDGASLSGTGEPGATVTVRDPLGVVLGTAAVAADGGYTVALTPVQIDGETLSVVQVDPAGNASPPGEATAPDLVVDTDPLAPTAAVGADGAAVSGTAEAGAAITVYDASGAIIATGTADGTGAYTVALAPPRIDGETVRVTQTQADGDVSPPATAIAPDLTAPDAPTATLDPTGNVVTGTGEPGATVTVTAADGTVLGDALVGTDGGYTVTLTTAQANGETLSVSQADAAGNVSPEVTLAAPDVTAPDVPTASVTGDGTQVVGTGEPGATITVTDAAGIAIGGALVDGTGAYAVTLTTPQANGETLGATQTDAAGNVSPGIALVAPDITAPPPPEALAVAADGTALSGVGEAGALVEVRDAAGDVIGTGIVAADGSFTVALAPVQQAGETLLATQADDAGNISDPGIAIAPFDIRAFDNAAAATIDLLPVVAPVALGTANYTALTSLGLVNLDAEVLAVPAVRFTVQAGHSLDATFTYDATLNLGVASGYTVVVQRFEAGQWVAVDGGGNASLLAVGLLDGNLSATDTLAAGDYRAFLTFDGTVGVGLLGALSVSGRDADYTDVGAVVPEAMRGNVIADPGPGEQTDIVGPGTHVTSVTVNGVAFAVVADGTAIAGSWGTLVIDLDGNYTYTPVADAGAIGQTDVFTYTLIDPTDGERESANLLITVGSPDIVGAPLAAADQAIAGVTYQNVVETVPNTLGFRFDTPTAVLAARTGTGTASFSVAANSHADVTISAISGGLALLPTYTLVVTGSNGAVFANVTQGSVVSLPLGTGTTFTLQDLPPGTYSYRVSSTNTTGTGYQTTVSYSETVTHLDQFTVAEVTGTSGHLLDNDVANTPFAAIRVDTGHGFVDVGDTPTVLAGQYGTLTVNETGDYSYQPNTTLGYSTVDLVDRFTYELVQPNGAISTATLSVTIDVPGNVGIAALPMTIAADHAGVQDAIPLDALVGHADTAGTPEAGTTAIAAYDLFEGQGTLEDVLGHYLAALPAAETATPVTDAAHVPVSIDVATAPVTDTLDYLVTLEDHDRFAYNSNHVV